MKRDKPPAAGSPPAAKEPRRKRLSLTADEIEQVAGGYWSALDAMARATTADDAPPAPPAPLPSVKPR